MIYNSLLSMAKIKTKEEIKNIKKACRITDSIFKKMMKNFNFKNESDIAGFIKKEIKKRELRQSFKPIVASGKSASNPHYQENNKKLSRGFCVIDFGVKYSGYCSDMTRTVFIGKPTKKERQIYNMILKSQTSAIKKLKPGVSCKTIANEARKHLKRYNKKMIHSTGHGLGKRIHEKPYISIKSNENLDKGMVFTIEPGIYLKNYGIRIEDTILLKQKPVILTKSEKRLINHEVQ